MRTIAILIIISQLTFRPTFGQLPENYLNKIRANFSCLIYGREHDTGNLLNWRAFKASEIEEHTGYGESIMMLGSATYLQKKLKEKYPDFKTEVIKAKSSYQIRFTFEDNSVDIFRRMVLSEQWKDNWAYERPENYYLTYAFNFSSDSDYEYFLSLLINFYNESAIPYKTEFDPSFNFTLNDIPRIESDDNFVTLNVYDIGTYFNSDLGNIQYDLLVNDSVICTVRKNYPQTIKLEKEGAVIISAKNRSGTTEIPVVIERGREYYIRCGISALNIGRLAFKGKPKLHLVISDYGQGEFENAINSLHD